MNIPKKLCVLIICLLSLLTSVVYAEISFDNKPGFISPNPTISLDDPNPGPGDSLLWPGSGDQSFTGNQDQSGGGRFSYPVSHNQPDQPDPGKVPDTSDIPSLVSEKPSQGERYSYPYPEHRDPYPNPTIQPYIPPTPAPLSHTKWCEPSGNIYPVYEDTSSHYRYTSSYDRDHYYRSDHSSDWYRTGSIQILSTPSRAEVYLNNKYRGKVPYSGYLEISNLIPGSYQVRVEYSGYVPYIRNVEVVRDEMETVSVALSRIEEEPALESSIQINSEPAGANAFLDNEFRGITPVTLKNLVPGDHTVTLQKSGYTDFVSKVQTTDGQTLPVTGVMMINQPQPTLVPPTIPVPIQTPVPVPTATYAGFSTGIVFIGLIGGGLICTLRRMR